MKTTPIVNSLTEGAGEPGYDVPNEEVAEVEIGQQIISVAYGLAPKIDASFATELQQIIILARQLIKLHTKAPPDSEEHVDISDIP